VRNAFPCVILFAGSGAFQSLLVDSSNLQAVDEGSAVTMVLWSFLYVIVALRGIKRYRHIATLIRDNKFLILLVLLAVASTAWSEDPGVTFRRSIALLGSTLIGIDFAIHYSIREQLRFLCVVLGFFVISSIVVQVFFPGLIPDVNFDTTAWHGVVAFKGNFAKMVVLAALAVICYVRPRSFLSDCLFITAVTSVAVALISAAHSIEALIIMIAMLVAIPLSRILLLNRRVRVLAALIILVTAIPIVYWAITNVDLLTSAMGRDPTLTGRVTLWQLSLSNIARSPLYGYGFTAFWVAASPEANLIREMVHFDTPHAHNGYIDLALALGLLGLVLFLAGYAVAVRRAIEFYRADIGRANKWPLMFLILFFLYQFTESSMIVGNSTFWIIYVGVSFALPVTSGSRVKVRTLESHPIAVGPLFARDSNINCAALTKAPR
jgi:exopolysaccharide production protein ExoQ